MIKRSEKEIDLFGQRFIEIWSGLPVLYTNNSGGIEETCHQCGLKFNNLDDLLEKINEIVKNYSQFQNKINYEFLGYERGCNQYLELINNQY